MFERFTRSARAVVVQAQQEARDLSHPTIGTEHLLVALLGDREGLGGPALKQVGLRAEGVRDSIVEMLGNGCGSGLDAAALSSIGIDLDAVRRKVEAEFGPGALGRRRPRRSPCLPFSPRAKKVLELSLRESLRRKDGYVGTEHVLLGILREGKGLAALILARAGIDRLAVEAALADQRRHDQAGTG